MNGPFSLGDTQEQLPKTKAEAESLGVRRYFTGKPCKHGHLEQRDTKHGCMGCRRVKKSAYRKTERGRAAYKRGRSTPQAKAAKKIQRRRRLAEIRADPALFELYRAAEREKKRRYLSTPSGKAYQRRKSLMKEEKVKRATPTWHETTLVNQFIAACPDGHHIDHIVPLKGKSVCGLHTLANLQYLPAQENLSKSNKVDPMTLDYAVCVLPEHRTYMNT